MFEFEAVFTPLVIALNLGDADSAPLGDCTRSAPLATYAALLLRWN